MSEVERWPELNKRRIIAEIGRVKAALARRLDPERAVLVEESEQVAIESALDALVGRFGLSNFERDVLVLCAGMELDSEVPRLCADANGPGAGPHPTFRLAFACFGDAHWSAATPTGALRYWGLIEVEGRTPLTSAHLRIDERVLHYLLGIMQPDERLLGCSQPLAEAIDLPPSHRAIAQSIARLWAETSDEDPTVVNLFGTERPAKQRVAAAAAAQLGVGTYRISGDVVPHAVAEREGFARLLQREAVLTGSALFLDGDDLDQDGLRTMLLLAAAVRGLLFLSTLEALASPYFPMVRAEVRPPSHGERAEGWRRALNGLGAELNGEVEQISHQFHLDVQDIGAIGALLRTASDRTSSADMLWEACRTQARPRLEELARRVETSSSWDDLVLPGAQKELLRTIAAQVRHRTTVYERWGFASKGPPGLGIAALFSGPTGTGKTMAAEVLANELRLDLYRIDLSAVVSKYIGETEKNLNRIFRSAEEGGAILLFDEADALFGKRSEVKDSHDRYANIEVSYLLQRMESYRGLAVLTTNSKGALDAAFMRRLRFVVQFPFPDLQQRRGIWLGIFPKQTPTKDLDFDRLATLPLAGGNIRNIAVNAAFIAASCGEPVAMAHILKAARIEYAKLDRPLTGIDARAWQ